MNRLFYMTAGTVFIVWCGINLWVAGYEQGYSEGEEFTWNRMNDSSLLLTKNLESQEQKPVILQMSSERVELADASEEKQ